ncbi:UNVERIFIED_CONTAM: hypothetical protein Slati_3161500 [Sesamum latifolium]|uniref:Uncharacterized protein n=1 Tax=Sesamum latifolium TaxID=2727402 RepID=A0AAW2UW54_9LAMI
MVEGTRVMELWKDVEGLEEQMRLSSEQTEKCMEELRGMIASLAAAITNPNRTGGAHAQPGEIGGESHTLREIDHFYLQSQNQQLQYINCSCSNLHCCKLLHRQQGTTSKSVVQSKRLSTQEIDEKRSKGPCYWCDEKYTAEHQCKRRRQLYLMEVIEGEEEVESLVIDEPVLEVEECDKGEKTINYQFSMNAMVRIHNYNTIRVTGSSKEKFVNILIDTGSTHNLLNLQIAKRLGCKLETTQLFPIAVANNNKLYSPDTCR